jgi:hypothetical protein
MTMRFLTAFTAMTLLAPMALAENPKRAREVQAHKDCLTGKVESGVEILIDLFTETNDPNYVFNQGRCYEQNARPAEAIKSFTEYLRIAKGLDQTTKADVDRHIAECRAMQADQEKQADGSSHATPAPAPASHASVETPGNVAGPSSPPVQGPVAVSPGLDLAAGAGAPERLESSSPFYKTWWFWGGVGAVVVAGTVTAVALASRGGGTAIPDSTLGSRTVSP